MFLAETIHSLLVSRKSTGVNPRPDCPHIWEISPPFSLAFWRREPRRTIRRLQRDIAHSLLASRQLLFIQHPDSPIENEVPGDWVHAHANTWFLPRNFDWNSKRTQQWLALGMWKLYSARDRGLAALAIPDFQASSSEQILSWLERLSIEVMIESFFDDSSWLVALFLRSRQPATPLERA